MLYENERSLYRYLDDKSINPKDKQGFIGVNWKDATEFNEKHFGIFWTVNSFNGERKNINLKKFLSWAIDLDSGDKKIQQKLIANFIEPSLVIESDRGFHVYYNAVDETDTINFKEIMINHLIPNLNADKGVNDLARVLRAPCFYHWKNIEKPFLVKIVHSSNKIYTDKQMISGFPPKNIETKETQKNTKYLKSTLKEFGQENIWDKIYNMDCEAGLNVLSGTDAVNGERYDFYKVQNGKKNIIVNGTLSASFIDRDGRIGSRSGGGPTLISWINWIHKDIKKTMKIMRQYFPEVFCDDKK